MTVVAPICPPSRAVQASLTSVDPPLARVEVRARLQTSPDSKSSKRKLAANCSFLSQARKAWRRGGLLSRVSLQGDLLRRVSLQGGLLRRAESV